MTKKILIFIAGLAVLIGMVYFAANKTSDPQIEKKLTLPEKVTIYDVRTQGEYDSGHVKGAKLLPDYDIADGKYPKLAKDAPIAVYCRSGSRSSGAAANLAQAGFTNVTDLGGLANLAKYGLKADS